MSPKLMKHIVKIVVGLAGTTLLGLTYKGEKVLQARIDDHFEPKTEETPES